MVIDWVACADSSSQSLVVVQWVAWYCAIQVAILGVAQTVETVEVSNGQNSGIGEKGEEKKSNRKKRLCLGQLWLWW